MSTFLLAASSKYGPFAPVVALAGCIMAMGAAVALGWRGRADWEPAEEDLSGGPRKVGGLVSACLIALAWATLRGEPTNLPFLAKIVIGTLVVTVMALLAYALLINQYVFEVVKRKPPKLKIIGGLWMTQRARQSQKTNDVTTQDLLAGAAYNPDVIWPRAARGLTKMLFNISYLALTVGGTCALGTAAILISIHMQK